MAGISQAVRIGPHWVTYGGEDLGYTKGGIIINYQTFSKNIVVAEVIRKNIIVRREIHVRIMMAESSGGRLAEILGMFNPIGTDLLTQGQDLVMTALDDPEDSLVVTNAFPLGNTQVAIMFNEERVWPVEFHSVQGSFDIGFGLAS